MERHCRAEQRNQTDLGRALLAVALRQLGAQIRARHSWPRAWRRSVRPGRLLWIDFAHRRSRGGGRCTNWTHRIGSRARVAFVRNGRLDSFAQAMRSPPAYCDCAPRAWVAREAVTKATGKISTRGFKRGVWDDSVHLDGAWSLSTLEVADGVFAAVAAVERPRPLTTVWLSSSQLSARTSTMALA